MRRPILYSLEARRKRLEQDRKYLYNLIKNKQILRQDRKKEALHIINEIVDDNYDMQLELEGANTNEPFGWPPGTVRGIITICITLVFLIILMYDFIKGVHWIPIDWFLGIVGAVILSYFYSRYKAKM